MGPIMVRVNGIGQHKAMEDKMVIVWLAEHGKTKEYLFFHCNYAWKSLKRDNYSRYYLALTADDQ